MFVFVELSSESLYEKLSDDVEVLLEDELMLLSDEDEKDGEGECVKILFLLFYEELSVSDNMEDKESLPFLSCMDSKASLLVQSVLSLCRDIFS